MTEPASCEPPTPERPLILPWIAVVLGFLLFAGLTVFYVSYSIDQSQHRWCDTINLLNDAPAPPPASASSQSEPGRVYDQRLSADFRALKARLGC